MLKVLKPGLQATVQDLGRFGYRDSGVPVSGAMDQYASQLANMLLNNDKNDAVIEVAYGGSSFQFLKDTCICLSGAELKAELNGIRIELNHRTNVKSNSILTFKNPDYGFRGYLAVKGGILNKKVLNSRSYFKEITKNYVLKEGDELLYAEIIHIHKETLSAIRVDKNHFSSTILDVYEGPEYELLSKKQKSQLKSEIFTISKDHSRMGYRLEETIENTLESMLTSATMPGTVQLTPSGVLIILMRDGGVTGGYPRVLQLTKESINRLAQKSTRDVFKFNSISI